MVKIRVIKILELKIFLSIILIRISKISMDSNFFENLTNLNDL